MHGQLNLWACLFQYWISIVVKNTLMQLKTVDFQLILAAAANCSLLDLSGSGANSVEESLTNLQDNADGGCTSTPSCTGVACDALGLGCVEAVVQQGDTSTAGDGEISSCELVQNCLDQNSCF